MRFVLTKRRITLCGVAMWIRMKSVTTEHWLSLERKKLGLMQKLQSLSTASRLSTILQQVKYNWASAWDFQQCGMCDQQSLRSACPYAQSDQSLCSSLEYSMIVKLLTEHHLEFLSLKGGCTASSESTLVKMLLCWKWHATYHLWHTIFDQVRKSASRDHVLCLNFFFRPEFFY